SDVGSSHVFSPHDDRSVDGPAVHARVNFLRPLENLVSVEMLLGVVHHLQDYAALPGHANAARRYRLLKFSGGLCGIEALTGGNPVGRRSWHDSSPVTRKLQTRNEREATASRHCTYRKRTATRAT